MKFGRNKSESDDGSTPSTPPTAAGATPPPASREPRESIAPRDSAAPRAAAPAARPAPGTPSPRTSAPPATAPEKTAQDTPATDQPAAAAGEPTRPHSGLTEKNKVRGTRVSGLWVGLVIAAILAVFLLIFIAQNSESVAIRFLTWEGDVPLAVAMLAAAVVSVLIVAVPGSLRIAQLRRALRKNAKG